LSEEPLVGLPDRLPVRQSYRWLARRSGKQFDRLSPLQLAGLSVPLSDQQSAEDNGDAHRESNL
jgi:hypothetical protein